jgi:mycoredoxin
MWAGTRRSADPAFMMADMDTPVTVYTTSWCGYCIRLKQQLSRAGIPFREVNIEDDASAAAFVVRVNAGNMTVPTVVLADGTALTNPSLAQLQRAMNSPHRR